MGVEKPIRKAANVSYGAQGQARPGVNKGVYSRKPATSAQASRSTYNRRPAGVGPTSSPVNDKDGGHSAYRS